MDRDVADCQADRLPLIGNPDPALPISFVLWGDSHARALVNLCDQLAKENGIRGVVATRSGTAPLLNREPQRGKSKSLQWNEAVLDYLRRHRVGHVIIVSRWSVCVRTRDGEDAARLSSPLAHTIETLVASGIRPWIMMQVPEQLKNPQHELALAAWSGQELPTGVDAEQHATASRTVSAAFASSGISPSVVLDPLPNCFDSHRRSLLGSGSHSYYRDGDHLSDAGAEQLIRPLLGPVIASIAGTPTAPNSLTGK